MNVPVINNFTSATAVGNEHFAIRVGSSTKRNWI